MTQDLKFSEQFTETAEALLEIARKDGYEFAFVAVKVPPPVISKGDEMDFPPLNVIGKSTEPSPFLVAGLSDYSKRLKDKLFALITLEDHETLDVMARYDERVKHSQKKKDKEGGDSFRDFLERMLGDDD